MSSDSVDRVEFLFEEIRESERTEAELWDFLERVAMELLMLRLEETVLAEEPDKVADDWGWDASDGFH